jgi:hypothetical protein
MYKEGIYFGLFIAGATLMAKQLAEAKKYDRFYNLKSCKLISEIKDLQDMEMKSLLDLLSDAVAKCLEGVNNVKSDVESGDDNKDDLETYLRKNNEKKSIDVDEIKSVLNKMVKYIGDILGSMKNEHVIISPPLSLFTEKCDLLMKALQKVNELWIDKNDQQITRHLAILTREMREIIAVLPKTSLRQGPPPGNEKTHIGWLSKYVN